MSLPRLLLESLEPRIAPAVIYAGPVSAGTTLNPPAKGTIATDQFATTSNGSATHFLSATGQPTTDGLTGFIPGTNYYIPLKAGDSLQIYNSGGFNTAITVASGAAEAFFNDYNHDGVAQANEITGLSVSAGAKFTVAADVNGDIVANLNAPKLSDPSTWTISVDNLISNKTNIAGLTMPSTSTVSGSIIAGGSISNLSVGNVTTVQSGIHSLAPIDYAFGGAPGVGVGQITEFSSNPAQGNGFLPAAKLTGGNLSNITVSAATGIYAGDGGAGAAGGSIATVKVVSDSTGIFIEGGNGGAAGAGSANSGGVGGAVSQVVIYGIADANTADNNTLIQISGGTGGDALAGSASAGGVGGAVGKVWVSYQYNSANQIVASTNWLHNDVTVQGGDGGAGATAGNGGAVTGTTLLTATPLSAAGALDIQVLGGDGGDLFAAGKKAGSGGSVTTFNIQNHLYTDPNTLITDPSSTVYVAGGDASAANEAPVAGTGAAGGSVTNSATLTGQLVGESFIFQGGNGSNTQSGGGAGGSVSNLQFGALTPDEYLQSLIVTSGTGGSSFTGNGGAGGTITGISALNAALTALTLTAGSGGDSLGNGTTGGIGGAGGSINSTNLPDSGATYVALDPVAGNGGDGFKGGGAGGAIQTFHFSIDAKNSIALASLAATAGEGGSVLGTSGNGGKGGSVSGVSFRALVDDYGGNLQTATLNAGFGGDAAGAGVAGAGGSITNSDIQTVDAVSFVAGIGGGSGGNKGKIGAGGSIGSATVSLGVIATSQNSSVTFQAGDAGTALSGTPSTGGAGGSILNARARAFGDISFQAGAGSIGGNGGDISGVAFDGASGALGSTGTLSVIAGAGGDAISSTTAAGRGGNVTNAVGYTSLDTTAADAAVFQAGAGGTDGKSGGAGGSVTGLSIQGGAQGFSVQAGDGGDGTASGGLGGSISKLGSSASVVVDSLAAGNGGNITLGGSTTAKGANGGSVGGTTLLTGVHVAGDIGIRTGENYGFATDGSAMGGIFAGTAGVNDNTAFKAGLAGNVTNITAQAIAAIVAGRAASPQLVNSVSGIFLGGNTAVTANANGSYSNFTTANLIGGKAGSPATANAVDFQTSTGSLTPSGSGSLAWTLGTTDPLDGLIATLTLANVRDVQPLAVLTTDSSQPGGYGLLLPPVTLA